VAESWEQAAATMALYDAFVDKAAMASELRSFGVDLAARGSSAGSLARLLHGRDRRAEPEDGERELAAQGLLHPDPTLCAAGSRSD
jgi:hypothetical protein